MKTGNKKVIICYAPPSHKPHKLEMKIVLANTFSGDIDLSSGK